ncbi:MAG: hypothetical protein JNM78_18655 [Cyclobacteriaceae bacterium]|nr:hypothetical protein [Cyclobacteriaceae bacterium]
MVRTVVVLMLLSYTAIAQKTNYLVTSKADTLYGEMRILSYDQLDRVQLEVGKKKEMFTALQVLSINIDGQEYKPLRYDNKIVLMKVLKQGYLSIYSFRLPNQHGYDGRLLTKLDGTSIEVPNLGFKKILSNYLEDCESVSSLILSGDLKRNDMDKILEDYNLCVASRFSKSSVSETVPPVANEITQSIESLIKKVEAEEFSSKKDALDLLRDIQAKVGKNETVPNYLSEGLKSYLKSMPAFSDDLEKLIGLLKK